MVKKYFVKNIAYNKEGKCNEKVFAAKKENNYMLLTTSKFKFLDVKNYIGPDLSYDVWCKSMGCRLQKLVFPYEWLDSYEKLSHVGPVSYEDFYSNLKSSNITRDEYKQFLKLFKENDCTTMGDWLRVYNVADVVPFIEAFRKMAEQYYSDKIDVCEDAVSIPGISMTYVLNKSLEKNKGLELYSSGGICCLCRDKREELQHCSCNGALGCGGYCEECQSDIQTLEKCECEKAVIYELLRTGMVGGPAQVFTRYYEKDITCIRSHVYGQKSKLTKCVILYDANSLYLYYSGDVMPCGKDTLIVNKKPFDQKRIAKFSRDVLKGKVFGFAQVDIEVPDELYDKFSEVVPLFVVQEIPDRDIPEEMKIYKEKTGRKTVKGTKKLLGVMKAKKILLYTPLIEWYLQHGLRLTAVHQSTECEPVMLFLWFPEEVANARREADKDPRKKKLGNVAN